MSPPIKVIGKQGSLYYKLTLCSDTTDGLFLFVSIQMRRRRVGMIGIMIFIEKTPEERESWVDFLGL